ncbi:unnamed protein product [Meganyctiphanes norvegica]|uniref:Ubiquitin-like domain-containing protein n=1 Tax=Meganyctiphanes norvegica TaxID=48144 RepID=A0AAV2PWI5_MEGNR
MSEEAKKEDKPLEHINLKVLGQDGTFVHFKIKKHTSLKKLMSAYCERCKVVMSTVRFRFDGAPISENDTPQGLEMEDGDTIEVFQQQTGGCRLDESLATQYRERTEVAEEGYFTHRSSTDSKLPMQLESWRIALSPACHGIRKSPVVLYL